MFRFTVCTLVLGVLAGSSPCHGQPVEAGKAWTIYITNDNCPDYTWGFNEQQTRQAFADIVKAALGRNAAHGRYVP